MGVLRDTGHEHFNGSLVVPILRRDAATGARTVEVYGRKVRDDLRAGTAEHLYLPGPHRGVFNLAGVMGADDVIVCEALIDALTFWCAGHRHVTAAYGVDGFTDEMLAASRAASSACSSPSTATRPARGRAALAERLTAAGIGAYRVQFPRGMDANEYALKVKPAAPAWAWCCDGEWIAGGAARRPAIPMPTPS